MAAPTAITSRIDRSLRALLAEVQDLPRTAEEWDALPDGERAAIALDWDHLLADYLVELDRCGNHVGGAAAQVALVIDRWRSGAEVDPGREGAKHGARDLVDVVPLIGVVRDPTISLDLPRHSDGAFLPR